MFRPRAGEGERIMAKVEVELSLEGFKMKIRADREDVPRIAQSVTSGMAGILAPIRAATDAELVPEPAPQSAPELPAPHQRRSRRAAAASRKPAADLPVWKHDPQRWGT